MGISLGGVNMIDRRVGDKKVQRVILNGAEIRPNERTKINFHIVDDFTGGGGYPPGRGGGGGAAFIGGDGIFSGGGQAYFDYSGFPDLSRAIRVKIVYQVYWDTTATDVNNLSGSFYYGNNQRVGLESYIVKRRGWNNYGLELYQGTGGQASQLADNPEPGNYTFTWDIKLTPQIRFGTTYPGLMSLTLSETDGTQIDENVWSIFRQEFIDNLHAANDFRLMLQPGIVVKSVDMYIYNGGATPRTDGFHIPYEGDASAISSYAQRHLDRLNHPENCKFIHQYFKMPYCGGINLFGTGKIYVGQRAEFRGSRNGGTNGTFGSFLYEDDKCRFSNSNANYGHSIRLFKDTPVIPDLNNGWVLIHGEPGNYGIYWNQSQGLISFSSFEQVSGYWYTLQDKNRGATQVWNYGDDITSANAGKLFQRGNNHGFDYDFDFVNTPFVYTPIDVTGYGDGIYYESDVYSKAGYNAWFTPDSTQLWNDPNFNQ